MTVSAAQPLGVVLDHLQDGAGSPFSSYLTEILSHAGLSYQETRSLSSEVRVLVVCGGTAPDGLAAWVAGGGKLLLLGDPGPLARLAGVSVAGHVIEGRVVFAPAPAWGAPPDVALRTFGGVRLEPLDSNVSVLGHWAEGTRPKPAPGCAPWPGGASAAVTVLPHGTGLVMVIGADVCQSVVRIQQGWPVHGDGIPPDDSTSPVDDGVLKVDDGIALSYQEDRSPPLGHRPTAGFRHAWPPDMVAPYFHRPHADLWRHILLRTLWWLAPPSGLPWLGYWPAGIPAVGHLSHDTDGNTDAGAAVALDVFGSIHTPSTWCLLPPEPGGPALSAQTLERIAAEGHEIGLHFDAHSPSRPFTEAELTAQLRWARASGHPVTTNKNHYLRWEGGDEFYRWCARHGILVDGSRGPGTQGNAGFPFGTSHVAYPLGDHPVLMLPLHFQDLAWTIQPGIADEVLGQVLAHHGVLHCLFHGENLKLSSETRAAVVSIVERGRAVGLRWWTAAQIGEWERARRGVTLWAEPGAIHIDSTHRIGDAAILIPLTGGSPPMVSGAPMRQSVVNRHSLPHLEIAVDLLPGRTTLRLR